MGSQRRFALPLLATVLLFAVLAMTMEGEHWVALLNVFSGVENSVKIEDAHLIHSVEESDRGFRERGEQELRPRNPEDIEHEHEMHVVHEGENDWENRVDKVTELQREYEKLKDSDEMQCDRKPDSDDPIEEYNSLGRVCTYSGGDMEDPRVMREMLALRSYKKDIIILMVN